MNTRQRRRLSSSATQHRRKWQMKAQVIALFTAALLLLGVYWLRCTTPHRVAKRFAWTLVMGNADTLAGVVMPGEQAELGVTAEAIKTALNLAGIPNFQPTRVAFFHHPFYYSDFYDFSVTWYGREGQPLGRSSLRFRSTDMGWRLEFVPTLRSWCRLRWGEKQGEANFYRICQQAGITGWVTRFGTVRRFNEPDPWTQP